MLKVTMKGDKWRIGVENEEWEFDDPVEFKNALEGLVQAKERFGRLQKHEAAHKYISD